MGEGREGVWVGTRVHLRHDKSHNPYMYKEKILTLIAYSSSEFPSAVGDGAMAPLLLVGVVGAEDEKKGLVVNAEASPPNPAPLGDPAPLTSGAYSFKSTPTSAPAGSGPVSYTHLTLPTICSV